MRRPGLDAALVDTAREAGAEVREGVRVTELVWDGGARRRRALPRRDGASASCARRSSSAPTGAARTVARAVGAERPVPLRTPTAARATSPTGTTRGADWRDDRRAVARGRGARAPRSRATTGCVLVLLMPPVERGAEFRADLEGAYERTVARDARPARAPRGLRAGDEGPRSDRDRRRTSAARPARAGRCPATPATSRTRSPRRASATRCATAACSARPPRRCSTTRRRSTRALRAWERRRERECLEAYQWTNQLARGEAMTPLEVELYRRDGRRPRSGGRDLLDVLARTRLPSEVVGPGVALGLAARALTRRGADRRQALRIAWRDLRTEIANRRERAATARGRAARAA